MTVPGEGPSAPPSAQHDSAVPPEPGAGDAAMLLGDGCGPPGDAGCCGSSPADDGSSCCFAKALMAQTASCPHAERRHAAEQHRLTCADPDRRLECVALRSAMHQRARFALKLPSAGRPMLHQQALRLQCGGLDALAQLLGTGTCEPPRLLEAARQQAGHMDDLPWDRWVAQLLQWQTRRRRSGGPPP